MPERGPPDGTDDFLSTEEVARLAGVGPTAVKRWADGGLLPCHRTAGGHRRFLRADVERFLRDRGVRAAGDADGLVDLLLRDLDGRATEAWLLAGRAWRGAWHRVADDVGAGLVVLGERWAGGRLSVFEEHVASARLSRALARVAGNLPVDPGAPFALLACAEGDEHTLGLSLAELCLREAGWNVLWAGARTPLTELAGVVRDRSVAMAALSASLHSADPAPLRRQAETLADACAAGGVALVLGGSGAWPDPPPAGRRLTSFEPFHPLAVELREREDAGAAG